VVTTVKLACGKHPRFDPTKHLDEGAHVTCVECRAVLDIYEVYVLHLRKYHEPSLRKSRKTTGKSA
jgi:hypothetical protein